MALACATAACAVAADWPTYRGDGRRSGYTTEPLSAELSPRWNYRPRHAPRPAWSGRDTRMPFDRAYHPVVAAGRLFFGNSADGKIYALDAATGAEQWTFFTGGPVRFPPTVYQDRLLAVSDDGFLYCLAVDDGRLLWKLRGGPAESLVLGNDRITSRWPARGAPVVADGIVYFGAGIWPSEGIFVYAVDAATGKVLWCNDESGGIYMGQPHGGANAASGISAQGHLALAGDVLLVPTGRAVPAALGRADGEFRYFHLQKNTKYGGAELVAAADVFFSRGLVFDVSTGDRRPAIPALRPELIAALPDAMIDWRGGKVRALRWTTGPTKDRRGATAEAATLEEAWSAEVPYGGSSLVVAGQTAVSAGPGPKGHGVSTVDLTSKRSVWSGRVDGAPRGLAVADGRLYVASDLGTIHCFEAGAAGQLDIIQPEPAQDAYADLEVFEQAAGEILGKGGVAEGYCVDLGCGDGALSYALAKQSKLDIYAIDPDPQNVARARRKLDAAGLYGARVTVHLGDPAKTPYPDYFASLVVSGRSAVAGASPAVRDEAMRLARPYGGVACLGKPGAIETTVRGPLEGAGSWTHQYCDPANTNCSIDTRVRGPLGMLWFTDFGFPMPSRHGRGRAPLFLDGRLFIEGLDGVLCVDAYNGRRLWHRPLPGIQKVYDGEHLMGTSGTGSNFCIGEHGLYVHTGEQCLRLGPATGRVLARFAAPEGPDGKPGTWGVIACVGDALFGTLANTEHLVTYRYGAGDMRTQFTESTLLFASDARTGRLRWRYQPEHSIRHNALAIGNGRVYLVDRPIALGDRRRDKRRGVPDPGDVHPPGRLVALDAGDGSVLWKSEEDVDGTVLALSPEHETLLVCYQDWRFKLASERGGRMAAFDAATGRRRWEIEASYTTRPIINGTTVYLQPGAWDLLSGKPKDFKFSRSYGCGIPSGSRHLMLFRSATLGYVDLLRGSQTVDYGGIRPGCWINTLPAGGLVLMPDATDRCNCSYLIKASIALAPGRAWEAEAPAPGDRSGDR
jgi:outer membrane protein assembly factor BamB